MKILVVRFSSIGDIVLTTSVLRCLKNQIPNLELHYLTKDKFKSILECNPHIDKLHTFEHSFAEIKANLKAEKYDYLIDLHHNIRTLRLKSFLGVKSFSFPKLNIEKWFLVYFKWNKMPQLHVVDRYFEAVKKLGVKNDLKSGEFYLLDSDYVDLKQVYQIKNYLAFALGAQYATKRLPLHKLIEILEPIDFPVVFLGDQNDALVAEELIAHFPNKPFIQACGKYSLRQSASIIEQSQLVLCHDTGLMHIAACFKKPIVSVWGNTIPELGMYPYLPKLENLYSIHQVNNLSCRPCSKIGFKSCPKKHFKCMNLQDSEAISSEIKNRFS